MVGLLGFTIGGLIMAQIRLTLPLDWYGLANPKQQWAHCVLDTKTYVDVLIDHTRFTNRMSEFEELIFLRACEYLWHVYHCADPTAGGAWWRFDAERDLRFVWSECVGRLRWGQSLEDVKLNKFQERFYTIARKAIEKRAEQYVAWTEKHDGIDPIVPAIDAMHEELEHGRDEPCWGLVDFDTMAFFPIEQDSVIRKFAQEIPGIELPLWLEVSLLPPEARQVETTLVGDGARGLLSFAIVYFPIQAMFTTRWLIQTVFNETRERDKSGSLWLTAKRLANYVIITAQNFLEELFNERGTGLLQLYSAQYRNRKQVPREKLVGKIIEFVVEKINDAMRKHGDGKRLSADNLKDYVRQNRLYKIDGDELQDEEEDNGETPSVWKACFYAICPTFLKELDTEI